MLREEDIVTALMAYKQGRSGFVLDPETMEVKTFEDVFQSLTRNRYMIDWPDQPEKKTEPADDRILVSDRTTVYPDISERIRT